MWQTQIEVYDIASTPRHEMIMDDVYYDPQYWLVNGINAGILRASGFITISINLSWLSHRFCS